MDNASDHAKRDATMTKIDITVTSEGRFAVENNGTGITTAVHSKLQYTPRQMNRLKLTLVTAD